MEVASATNATSSRFAEANRAHPGWAAPEARGSGALLGALAALLWIFTQGQPTLAFCLLVGCSGALLGAGLAYCIKPIVVLVIIFGAGWGYLQINDAANEAQPAAMPIVPPSPQPAQVVSQVEESKSRVVPKQTLTVRIAELKTLREQGDNDTLLERSNRLRLELTRSHPAYAEVVGNYLWALSAKRRWEDADRWIDEILATRDLEWSSYAIRQRVQNAAAAGDWDRLLAMSPSDAWSKDLRLGFLRQRGIALLGWEPSLAVRDFEQALRIDLNSASLVAELAEAQIIAGQQLRVLNLPARVARHDPNEEYQAIAWLLECIARRMLALECSNCEQQLAAARSASWSFRELEEWLARDKNPHEAWIRAQIDRFPRRTP